MEKYKYLILLPCFNEEDYIEEALHNLDEFLKLDNIELLAIDDGSTDSTYNVLTDDERVDYILKSNNNQGLARVFTSAQKFALDNRFDYLIIYDCDSQYPAAQIKELISRSTGNDIVIGCRDFKQNQIFSKFKNLLQIIGSKIISIVAGVNISDVTSGFRIYNNYSLKKLLVTDNFSYTIDTLLQAQRHSLKIDTFKLLSFKKTRDSRLFDSNFKYIYLAFLTILNSILIYREKFIIRIIYILNFTIGATALSRFFIPFFQEGENPGNIQSLIFGSFLIVVSFLLNLLVNQRIHNKKLNAILLKTSPVSHY